MRRILPRALTHSMLLIGLLSIAHAGEPALDTVLSELAPTANPGVISLALAATECAVEQGQPTSDRLAVIDYSKPSTEPRLWVFDLTQRTLLYHELVAHGRNTGENLATKFSNTPESWQTSLGLFRTRNTYSGRNGYSLRMEGLEPGINDRAMSRALVIHGADYVTPFFASQQGRIGRSHGCPAVNSAIARPLIDTLKDGQYLFSYYPDLNWLSDSQYLKCSRGRALTANLGGADSALAPNDSVISTGG